MANPYDFDRDGRWSAPERAFSHYGIGEEFRRADSERGGGTSGGRAGGSCLGGCAASMLVLAALLLVFMGLATCAAA